MDGSTTIPLPLVHATQNSRGMLRGGGEECDRRHSVQRDEADRIGRVGRERATGRHERARSSDCGGRSITRGARPSRSRVLLFLCGWNTLAVGRGRTRHDDDGVWGVAEGKGRAGLKRRRSEGETWETFCSTNTEDTEKIMASNKFSN